MTEQIACGHVPDGTKYGDCDICDDWLDRALLNRIETT